MSTAGDSIVVPAEVQTPWIGLPDYATARGSSRFDGCDNFCSTQCVHVGFAPTGPTFAASSSCTARCADECRRKD